MAAPNTHIFYGYLNFSLSPKYRYLILKNGEQINVPDEEIWLVLNAYVYHVTGSNTISTFDAEADPTGGTMGNYVIRGTFAAALATGFLDFFSGSTDEKIQAWRPILIPARGAIEHVGDANSYIMVSLLAFKQER